MNHDLQNSKKSKTAISHGDYIMTDAGLMQARGDGHRLQLYAVHNRPDILAQFDKPAKRVAKYK